MDGYKITVNGTYRARTGDKGKTIRHFDRESFYFPKIVRYSVQKTFKSITLPDGSPGRITVPLIEKANALHVANHQIQRFYLPPRLRNNTEKYPDFSSLREVFIVKVEQVELSEENTPTPLSPANIDSMLEQELLQFVVLHDLNVTVESYHTLPDKQRAVKAAYRVKQQQNKTITAPADPLLSEPETLNSTPDLSSPTPPAPPAPPLIPGDADLPQDGVPVDEEVRGSHLLE